MGEVAKYLTSLGAAPAIIIFAGVVIWGARIYVNHKLQKERKKWEEKLKFIFERHVARSRLLEEINGLIYNFDHYVIHVFEGDGGWYEKAIEEKYKELRELARNKIELVAEFNEFLSVIYSFTDNGKDIIIGEFNFSQYKESKKQVNSLISKIRETLPSVK